MGTHCNIIIQGEAEKTQLFRHYDGYPDGKNGVLCEIADAVKSADCAAPSVACYEDAILRMWNAEFEDTVYPEGAPDGWEQVHSDVQWVYVIEIKGGDTEPTVAVYDWTDHWFGKLSDENPPVPVVTVPLSACAQTGLDWPTE